MTNITIPIPIWLDLLFALPVLLFRFFKLGYTYRKIPLGQGLFTKVDPDAYYRLNKFQWSITANNGLIYAVRYALTKSGKTAIIEMHREIINAPKNRLVDHQNNSTLDNRTNNLRLATRSQNACNRRKKNNTSSRFRGVFLEKRSGHWGARIYLNGKQIWLGYFDSELDAARAYDRAAVKYHGEFARLNFPQQLTERCTLNAERCTLNPERCTLNAERCTPNAERCIRSRTQKPLFRLAFLLVLFIMLPVRSKQMRFTKMHGIGNDYVFVDCFREKVANPAKIAIEISDRHFGVGSDGLILICPSKKADAKMRIFNADGSEAEMCGNGIRCVAKYVYEHKLAKPRGPVSMGDNAEYPASFKIETKAGILTIGLELRNKTVENACVNMGEPRFRPKDIPVKLPGSRKGCCAERIIEHPIDVLKQRLPVTCVSMGNPHAVFFCDDVNGVELWRLGPAIENSRIFPRRTNVHFVEVESKNSFRMRTWERGSGITLACGTGACACCVAAAITGRCSRRSTAKLPGGQLLLNWSAQDNCVYMAGPATEVFEGVWP